MSPMTAWANFYVIVGSSAGALTGLTFVVVTLMPGRRMQGASWGMAAFTTPTVAHFGAALLGAAILSAPWPALWQAALLLGLCGASGIAYCAVIARRMRRQVSYQPLVEDWLWFAVVPLVAYATLLLMALLLPSNPTPALFGFGATLLLLLFTGIRNAWDLVTFIAIEGADHQDGPDEPDGSDEQARDGGQPEKEEAKHEGPA
ncbi:MAG TPA: hypothetical protein VFQ25_10555 [Ktedonobacterales bacterium]|nr:hypothetical protein [Ktedonobacterales bacterium]